MVIFLIHLICPNPAIDRTLLFDNIIRDKPNRPVNLKEIPGGKGFNVAYALSFDSDVKFKIHTILGGKYGEQFMQLAANNHYPIVKTTVGTNTRLCHILVDKNDRSLVLSQEYGFKLNDKLLDEFTKTLLDSVNTGDYLVFSGSLMKGMPTTYINDIYYKLQERNIKVKLVVDTSGNTLKDAYKLAPYMVKINDEEIYDIFPEKKLDTIQDYFELLQNNVDQKINNFIITLGSKGAVGRIDGEYLYGYCKPVDAKNPNASGDFFLGRMMNGINHNSSPIATLKDAIAFSTGNVENWFPEVTKAQLSDIKKDIKIKNLQSEEIK